MPKYFSISEVVDPIEVLDSCKINASLGGLDTTPPMEAGMTYLARYTVSIAFLVSVFLLM